MDTRPVIWVGSSPPAGLVAQCVHAIEEAPANAGVLVFDPPPPLGELRRSLPAWEAREAVVVVCVPQIDLVAQRAWQEAGAYAWCRAAASDSALVDQLARLRQSHQPTRDVRLRRIAPRLAAASFSIRTFEEAEALSEILALALPEPLRRVAGILELLLNAIEHGNLGITAEHKQALLRTGSWQRELHRRLEAAPWAGRHVQVTLMRNVTLWSLIIEDEGDGFVADEQAPQLGALRGRGVAMARAAFDEVRFERGGRRVVACVELPCPT